LQGEGSIERAGGARGALCELCAPRSLLSPRSLLIVPCPLCVLRVVPAAAPALQTAGGSGCPSRRRAAPQSLDRRAHTRPSSPPSARRRCRSHEALRAAARRSADRDRAAAAAHGRSARPPTTAP